MASVIDSHPAKQQIIDGILSGKSYTELAKMADVSVMCVSRYARSVVRPAVRYVKTIESQKLAEYKRDIPSVKPNGRPLESVKSSPIASALPIFSVVDRLKKRDNRREEWIEAAERDANFGALTSLDSNGLREIELECKLLGLLNDGQGQASTTINLVCQQASVTVTPSVTRNGSVTAAEDYIDISPLATSD